MKHIELNLILKHQCVLLANKGRGYHGKLKIFVCKS